MVSIGSLARLFIKMLKILKYPLSFLLIFCFHVVAVCQAFQIIIPIKNGSFEDIPGCCKLPDSWLNTGPSFETPPDIHPALDEEGNYFFGVTQMPKEGRTYLGMVVREYGTHERIRQKLSKKLIKDSCYQFTIYLCKSELYESVISGNYDGPVNFNNPCILRIWGAGKKFRKMYFLIGTEPIGIMSGINSNLNSACLRTFMALSWKLITKTRVNTMEIFF